MDDIRQRWQPLFGPRMVCLAAVPHHEVPAYLKCLDIFVFPSFRTPLWQEQFGLTLAQAMLAGAACIGTESGAIPEVLAGGGVLVSERDVAGLARALEAMIQSEPYLREMKGRAQAIARVRYTNEAVARKYLDVFATLTHGFT